jgi:hypothetical protein
MKNAKHTMKVWVLEDETFRITGAHISVLQDLSTEKDWKQFITQLAEVLGDSLCPSGDTDGIYFLVEASSKKRDSGPRSFTATRVLAGDKRNLTQVSVPSGSIGAFSLHSLQSARVGSLALYRPEYNLNTTLHFGLPIVRAKGPVRVNPDTQKMLNAMGSTLHSLLGNEA